MSFKFIKTKDDLNSHDIVNVQVELPDNDASLDKVFEAFTQFLLGCSYSAVSIGKFLQNEIIGGEN